MPFSSTEKTRESNRFGLEMINIGFSLKLFLEFSSRASDLITFSSLGSNRKILLKKLLK